MYCIPLLINYKWRIKLLVLCREEVMRAMPQFEEMKRRARKKEREAAKAAARAEEEAIGAKRQGWTGRTQSLLNYLS